MQVVVKNGNVERAMRTLKKKLQKEGLLKELKQKQYFEKPSAKRKRKKADLSRGLLCDPAAWNGACFLWEFE